MPTGQRANPCSECGAKGNQHFKACSKSGKKTPAPARHTGVRARSHKKKEPTVARVPSTGDNIARATAKTLLDQLLARRADLDLKIKHVEELVELL